MNNTLVFAADNQAILPHDINEVIWGSIAFFLVVGLIVWKGGPAIKKAWNGRIEGIENDLSSAEQAVVDAEAELADVQQRIANADAESEQILAEARATAETLRQQLAERAAIEAAEVTARAAADVEAAKSQAMADLQHEVADLTMGAAEALVRSNLDADAQQRLVESYITEVGSSS
jgi:F-type H+-transporting ATPase subunit b